MRGKRRKADPRTQLRGGNSPGWDRRTCTRKPAETMRCVLITGSVWSTGKKYMHKETFDIFFFMIEHWLRKEEKEEKFNNEAMQGWTFCSRRSKNHRQWHWRCGRQKQDPSCAFQEKKETSPKQTRPGKVPTRSEKSH